MSSSSLAVTQVDKEFSSCWLRCRQEVKRFWPACGLKQEGIPNGCDQKQKMLWCKMLCTGLNVKSFLYCIFGKKESEEMKFTVCNDVSCKSLPQTVDELWKRAGLTCRSLVNCDQWECLCVCSYKVWECYMNPFRSHAAFCYRPLPLPRPLFASWPEQLINHPLANDQPFY